MAEEKGSADGEERMEDFLFPYDSLRNVQRAMIQEVANAIAEKRNLIVHAPTGLGKTSAAIAPALKYAIENKKKVFFLTSRHTQHLIAIETLKEIKKKYGTAFVAADIIGKKWMCTVPAVDKLHTSEFYEYCKKQREDKLCEQYNNTRDGSKMTTEAKLAIEKIHAESPCSIDRIREICLEHELCPFEVSAAIAKEAAVIVADYYYIYNKKVRDSLFNKAQIELSDCVVIVDEGHNLPDRIRNLMTVQLSNYTIKRAITEAKTLSDDEIIGKLARIQNILNTLSEGMRDGEERLVTKEEFLSKISDIGNYDDLSAELQESAKNVRDKERQSFIGTIATFLEQWPGEDTGYARILSQKSTKRESVVVLAYRCLDPAIICREIIESCHSTIIMSGTLTPTEMYKDILGFPADTAERRYKSPFPDENKLSMIVPETTTKFSMRNPEQYRRIAQIVAEVTNLVPGNSAVFFPSYYVRDQIYSSYSSLSKKTAFIENPEMTSEERKEFLERFKKYKDSGAVLLGVVSGSFGEGIDLPGDLLKCVVVVGLPLQQPSLETKELIKYYDSKFNKGWDYGYVGPAFSKCLQSAGRCIRSESDRGVVVFLDERYVWQNYFRHFPRDMEIKITKNYADEIKEFF